MLEFLRGKVSDRQLRLFGLACCRRVWHLIQGKPYFKAVEAMVGCALHHRLSVGRWREAWSAAWAYDGSPGPGAKSSTIDAAASALAASVPEGSWPGVPDALAAAGLAANNAAAALAESTSDGQRRPDFEDIREAEQEVQAAILRDVVGNPFHPASTAHAWQAWDGGTVVQLARGIDQEQAFDRLPILADALEEAGCTDSAILSHCRGKGPHVWGCWVVALVLGQS
jgi:hypothetical protein